MMPCSKCRKEAVVFQPYSGQHLCREHFILDFEVKAKREIRKNTWMQPGDHIAVLLTGADTGYALLEFLRRVCGARKDIRISGVPAGTAMDLNPVIREMKVTRIASPASLEEVSCHIVTYILQGRADCACRPEFKTVGGVPYITPFRHIPAVEVSTYARFLGTGGEDVPPGRNDAMYTDVAALMADYTRRHPAAPHAVLNLCEALNADIPSAIEQASRKRQVREKPRTRAPNS